MKVAIVNKFFFAKGGQETLIFEEAKLLEQKGIEVAFFSMHHPDNPSAYKSYKYNKYFVDYVEFSNMGNEYTIFQKLNMAKKFIYNKQAAVNFDMFLNDFKPDIVHLHGIAHQITMSILPVAKKYNIPVIQTLHDYQLICPSYSLLKGTKTICNVDCSNGRFYNCTLNKCVKNSLSASLLSSAEMYFNHKINNFADYIDKFISPSIFLGDLIVKSGIFKEKLVHIPNFVNNIENYEPEYNNKGYFVYLGRLSFEKGLFTLLKAFKDTPEASLKIIGTGPLEEDLIKFKNENQLNNVEFLGYKTKSEFEPIVKSAIALILPAEWLENAPMSIIEAFGYGKPFIASDLGGIPEMVESGYNGFIFEHGNTNSLKQNILKFLNDKELSNKLGNNARKFALEHYTGEKHLKKLINLYTSVIDNKTSLKFESDKKEQEVNK